MLVVLVAGGAGGAGSGGVVTTAAVAVEEEVVVLAVEVVVVPAWGWSRDSRARVGSQTLLREPNSSPRASLPASQVDVLALD